MPGTIAPVGGGANAHWYVTTNAGTHTLPSAEFLLLWRAMLWAESTSHIALSSTSCRIAWNSLIGSHLFPPATWIWEALNLLPEELEAEPRTVAQTASTNSQKQSKQCLRPLPAFCPQTVCPDVTALPRTSYIAVQAGHRYLPPLGGLPTTHHLPSEETALCFALLSHFIVSQFPSLTTNGPWFPTELVVFNCPTLLAAPPYHWP